MTITHYSQVEVGQVVSIMLCKSGIPYDYVVGSVTAKFDRTNCIKVMCEDGLTRVLRLTAGNVEKLEAA